MNRSMFGPPCTVFFRYFGLPCALALAFIARCHNALTYTTGFSLKGKAILFSLDDTIGDYYYFNVENGETQWAHPLDEIYRQKVKLARESKDVTSSTTDEDTKDSMDKPKLVRKFVKIYFSNLNILNILL